MFFFPVQEVDLAVPQKPTKISLSPPYPVMGWQAGGTLPLRTGGDLNIKDTLRAHYGPIGAFWEDRGYLISPRLGPD